MIVSGQKYRSRLQNHSYHLVVFFVFFFLNSNIPPQDFKVANNVNTSRGEMINMTVWDMMSFHCSKC